MKHFKLSQEDSAEAKLDLQAFLRQNYSDKLIILTKANYNQIKRPLLVFFHYFKLKGTELKQWTDKLHALTQQFPKTIQFGVMDFENAELFHLDWHKLNKFEFDANTTPYIYAIDAADRQHEFDEELTPTALQRFCEYLQENKHYYSDDLPTKQDADINVDIIVADNFLQLVEHNTKDVFVTLHSKYSIKYELNLWGVARELEADDDTLVFYGINAYTNWLPLEYRVTELPTSFFIPRRDKSKRLRYVNQYLDGEEVKRLIAKNASTELKTLDRKGRYKGKHVNRIDQNEEKELRNVILKTIETAFNNKLADDNGFFEFLSSILKKIGEKERNEVEMELAALALNRINKIGNK